MRIGMKTQTKTKVSNRAILLRGLSPHPIPINLEMKKG